MNTIASDIENTNNIEVTSSLRSTSSVETLTINPNGGSAKHIDGTTITSSQAKTLGSLISIGETKSFSRNTYTVTLNKGTGIASVSGAGTYYYGQSATISAELLTGYKWLNWTGTVTYGNISNTFTVDSDKTFTANAEPIIYTVRFNGNGNWNTSQGSYTQQFTYDVPDALTPNKFTRPDSTTYNNVFYKKGYEFIGWGTSSTQTTATYSNKQTVKNLTTSDGATIDLYALWKKSITLTINFNGGKFNDDSTSKVLSYTMYNSELNHTFDIKQYYGTLKGTNYNSKGLNNNLTKTDNDEWEGFIAEDMIRQAQEEGLEVTEEDGACLLSPHCHPTYNSIYSH